MSSNAEQIEAKLAAYIDGLLPESDRAEIEAYLTANPSHKTIVEELRGHKILVTSLPRDRAPLEILDHVQTHLERTTLLQDVEDAASSMHINRFPQYAAIAAVMLLAVGLAAIVYEILPNNNRPNQVVLAPPTAQQLPPSVLDDTSSDKETHNNDIKARNREDGILSSLKDVPEATLAPPSQPANAKDEISAVSKDVAREAPSKPMFAAKQTIVDKQNTADDNSLDRLAKLSVEQAAQSSFGVATKDKQLYSGNISNTLIVDTDDLALTNTLVAGYLLQNKLDWDALSKDQYTQLASNLPGRDDTQEKRILIVRNLTPEQANVLNNSVNSQRAGKQNARLYPQGNNVVLSGNTPIILNNGTLSNSGNASMDSNNINAASINPTEKTPPGSIVLSQNQFLPANTPITNVGQLDSNKAATQPTTQPSDTTLPAGDLLIIVRTHPPTISTEIPTPTTIPTTQPSTKPTDNK